MPVTTAQWKYLYGVFNPAQRLDLTDADLFVERPGAVAAKIANDLQLETAGKWVVCGSMGSGKSSELAHLGGMLRDDYAVIGLDLPNTVASVDRIQPAEVLFLIGVAAIRAAADLWDQKIGDDAIKQLQAALRPLLTPGLDLQPSEILQGAALFAANVVAPGSTVVAGAVGAAARALGGTVSGKLPRSRPSPINGVTRTVHDGEPDLVRLQEAVDRILAEVAEVRPPIVLVDGLDKIQELPSIRKMFSTSRILCLPASPIIYAAPITLMLATEYQAVAAQFRRERLTNIVIRRPDLPGIELADAKLQRGLAVLREVVEKRLALADLPLAEVFAGDSLDRLIASSGGVLRNLILVCRYAIEIAFRNRAPHVSAEVAEEAVNELRKEYEITMNGMRRDELIHILTHGEPSGRDVSLELLLGGYALPYSNGKVWFEPHPILRGGLARRA